jgi:hypothetical protein
MAVADTFYCISCRFAYPIEKAAHVATGVHRDGEAVGFCFLCVREIRRDVNNLPPDQLDELAEERAAEAAGA